jgi:hypothetical protein
MNLSKWVLAFVTFLPLAHASAQGLCGRLNAGDTYARLNEILACLEGKLGAAKSPSNSNADPDCWSQDDNHPLLRGCVKGVLLQSNNTVAVRVSLKNKAANRIVMAIPNHRVTCGAHLTDDIGNPYGAAVSGCGIAQRSFNGPDKGTEVDWLLTNGTSLTPGSEFTENYIFVATQPPLKSMHSWTVNLELVAVEESRGKANPDKFESIRLAFPEARKR